VRRLILKSKIRRKRLRDKDLIRAFQIVSAHGTTFYDSLYLALAERLGAGFVTADYKASARLATRTDVLELRNY
jgi:predicted nucleic acid-binding protein